MIIIMMINSIINLYSYLQQCITDGVITMKKIRSNQSINQSRRCVIYLQYSIEWPKENTCLHKIIQLYYITNDRYQYHVSISASS